MLCSVCKQNRNEIHPKKSRLMADAKLYLCNECLKEKREPRYLVVLHGRSNGIDSISDYIKNKRYVGAEILLSELI